MLHPVIEVLYQKTEKGAPLARAFMDGVNQKQALSDMKEILDIDAKKLTIHSIGLFPMSQLEAEQAGSSHSTVAYLKKAMLHS